MVELNTFKLIERISTLVRSEERRIYTALALQPVHGQVLEYISQCNHHSNTPASVTEYLGLTRGTMSQSIQVLERKGYIEKYQDKIDRRVVHLKLLPAGQALVDKIKPLEIFQQAEQQISSENFTTLTEGLTKTLIALQQANRSKSFGLCNTCDHFAEQDNHYHCRLTDLPLEHADTEKICKEHTVSEEQLIPNERNTDV